MLTLGDKIAVLLRIIRYSGPEKFAVEIIDVPAIGDDDVLVRLIGFYSAAYQTLIWNRSKSQHVVYAELYVIHSEEVLKEFFLTEPRTCTTTKGSFLPRYRCPSMNKVNAANKIH